MQDYTTFTSCKARQIYLHFFTGLLICLLATFLFFPVSVCASDLADQYENDDSPESASIYYLFSTTYQSHNLHSQGDEDWIQFYTDETFGAIEIKTYEPEENCETIITLFDSDKTTQLKEQRFTLSNGVNLLSFRPEKNGLYYARIKNKDDSKYGSGTGYKLSVYLPVAPFSGTVDGIVTDSETRMPLQGVHINIENNYAAATTESDGFYFFQCPAGTFTLYASKDGYQDYSSDIEVGEIERTELNFSLSGVESCGTDFTGAAVTGIRVAGSPVSFTANTQNSCGDKVYHRYSVHPGYGTDSYDGTQWEGMTATEWVADGTIDYTFTQQDKYIVVVWADNDPDNADPNGIPIVGWSVNTNDETCKTDITGYNTSNTLGTDNSITFTVNAENSCSSTLYYRFSVHPGYGTDSYDGTQWESMTATEWIPANTVDYTFTEGGKYIVVVWVTDEPGKVNPNGVPIIGWSVKIE